jgi:dihydrofolate synthase / folylpolyglutamate synthase
MSYAAAIDNLLALSGELHASPGAPRRKFWLEDMRILMGAFGDPQRLFPPILVAGTNGKGSTSATLASILTAAGYRTGLYTSPHLSRVNERIRIDGEMIPDAKFAERYFRVHEAATLLVNQGKLPTHPSFFETMTAIAFLTFAEEQVSIAVLEVGMGGRLDATNIVEPMVSVITDISLDHTEWLGSTISAIAREKAGILRHDGVLITLPQHPEANQAIGEAAMELHVRGVSATNYMPSHAAHPSRNQYPLEVLGEVIEVDSPLGGSHQRRNIALAIAAAIEIRNNHGYKLDAKAIETGVRNTNWPGRLERFEGDGTRADLLIDVAHNPAGAWALRSALSASEPADRSEEKTLIFGCLADKAVAEMAQILFPLFDLVILTEVESPRAATLKDMEAGAALTGVPFQSSSCAAEALQTAMEQTAADGLIVACGSVYLAGRIRELITEQSFGVGTVRATA